jgi:hypothetical protein
MRKKGVGSILHLHEVIWLQVHLELVHEEEGDSGILLLHEVIQLQVLFELTHEK